MPQVPFFHTADTRAIKTIRDDIMRSIDTVFDDFRTVPTVANVCADEYEDIVFITQTNALAYVKVLSDARLSDVASVCGDVQLVQRKWARACEQAGLAVPPVEMRIIAEQFDNGFITAVSQTVGAPCCGYTIRMIVNAVGGVAYVFDPCAVDVDTGAPSEASVTTGIVKADPIADVPRSAEPPAVEPAAPVSDEDDTVSTCTQKVEVAAQPATGRAVIPELHDDDFFHRSQLSTEEEREFFLLNKQLSEYGDGR